MENFNVKNEWRHQTRVNRHEGQRCISSPFQEFTAMWIQVWGTEESVGTTGSPGTARCLRGMALSWEEREPIQSALTVPMPAGRVFMSETVCQRKPVRPTGKKSSRSCLNVLDSQNDGLTVQHNSPACSFRRSMPSHCALSQPADWASMRNNARGIPKSS